MPIDRPHHDGIHAFLGPSESPPPAADALRVYRSLGLRRLAVGLSTDGDPGPDDTITPPDELTRLVVDARSAGIAMSVVTWLSPGRGTRPISPPEQTASLIRSLGLGAGDHVYLVAGDERPGLDLDPAPDPDPTATAADAVREQETALLTALAPLRRESGVKVLPYSLRKQGR